MEALLGNRKSPFGDAAWNKALEQATETQEIFTDRSPLAVSLMLLMAKVPGLAKRTTHAVVVTVPQEAQDEQHEQELQDLMADVDSLRARIVKWRRDFNTALIHAVGPTDNWISSTGSNTTLERGTDDAGKRYELLGISLVVHMLAGRMLVSLSPPGDRGALLLEDEVQAVAAELGQVHRSVPSGGRNHRARFVLLQKTKIADAAVATHADFRRAAMRDDGRAVEPLVLKRFCELLGRKCCDGQGCCP